MYTIKQAAARSGLSVPTVRAWERRYGVVHPERTPTGYRLYDDRAIGRLIAMRHLVAHDGMRPSQAAERIVSGDEDLAALIEQALRWESAAVTPSGGGAPSTAQATADVDAFVSATRRLDVPTIDRILDNAFASERFESALEHVVFPALRAVGDGWADGSIDVAMEHAASETVRRRLARFYHDVASDGAPDVIVGLPPGGYHEIGALAFAVAARRHGVDVLYLGADVPLASWVTAVETSLAPVALVAVVAATDVAAADEVVRALRRAPSQPTVVLGGVRAHELREAEGSVLLPASMDEAVAVIHGLLARAVSGKSAARVRARGRPALDRSADPLRTPDRRGRRASSRAGQLAQTDPSASPFGSRVTARRFDGSQLRKPSPRRSAEGAPDRGALSAHEMIDRAGRRFRTPSSSLPRGSG